MSKRVKFASAALLMLVPLLLCAVPGAQASWVLHQGSAMAVSFDAQGTVWVIGTNAVGGGFGLYRWNGLAWNCQEGGAITLVLGPDNEPWVINNANKIYSRSGGSWNQLPGLARDIGINKNGKVYIIGTDACESGYNLYSWNNGNWTKEAGCANKVAVDPEGYPWVVDASGAISRLTPTGWQQLPGAAYDIDIGVDGTCYVVGRDRCETGYGIYHWNGSGWDKIDGCASHVTVDPSGNPWVTNWDHQIFKTDTSIAGKISDDHLAKLKSATCPTPLEGNGGKYMCPYTSDDVLAEWVDKGINVKTGEAIGAGVGAVAGGYAGQQIMNQVPLVGGLLGSLVGKAAGEAIGRQAAVSSFGGWEYVKETSDLSFNSVDDMVVYIYLKHAGDANFPDVVKAVSTLYPEVSERFDVVLSSAGLR